MWAFENVPDGYWEDLEHQRRFIRWLESKLELKKPEDWYSIKKSQVIQCGGTSLLQYCGGNLVVALKKIYPEIHWEPWIFDGPSVEFWDYHKNRRRYLDWISEQLNMKYAFEWYKVYHCLDFPPT